MDKIIKKRKFKVIAVLILLGMAVHRSPIAYASEEVSVTEETEGMEQAVSYIYHQHIGNSTEEGGCYRQPVYHGHTGDEAVGGSCYETPVYHGHIGDEINGGSCYETINYHVHEGDGTAQEGCYVASYHTHNDECYREIDDDEYGCHTVNYWDTSDGDYEGKDFKYYEMSCGRTIHGTNSSHTHIILNCDREDEITAYILGCGKTNESIESYALSCIKTGETIDSYELSCSKTAEDIDEYEKSCGKEEDIPYGKVIVNKQLIETEKVIASVEIEDLTGGELQFSETPVIWYDGQGKVIGTDDSITLSENGTYQVKADIANEDINKESLWSEVNVDSIRKPESSDNSDSREEDNASEDSSSQEEESMQSPSEPIVTPTVTPIATPTATPMTEKKTEKTTAYLAEEQTVLPDTDERAAYRLERIEPTATISPASTPDLKKETRTVKNEEKKSNVEFIAEPKEMEKASFFASPVSKLIIITAGTFAALTGIFLLFYLLRWSVSIYNDDGQGNMTYLGRSMVRFSEEGYLILITEQMAEKAITNRYCIKPGLFRIGRGKEEEILVEKQEKRISVLLQKEMIVVI